MIKITSKADGFRRCGVAHPATLTEHPDDRFTSAELAILKAEPMLVVEEVTGGTKTGSQCEDNDQGGSGKNYALNAKATQEKIKAATTIEEVDELVKDDDRKGVLDAAEKRRKELQPAE